MNRENDDDVLDMQRWRGGLRRFWPAAKHIIQSWPAEAAVSRASFASDDGDRLREVIEGAEDEAPVQQYLTQHRVLLSVLGGRGPERWVFPKLKLGEQWVTDFAVASLSSGGLEWALVELESPLARALTRVGGEPSREFRHAKQQIDDWRIWLRDNIAYIQNKYPGLDDTFTGVIILGRREDIADEEHFRKRYRELSTGRLEVMSYDRFLERVSDEAARTEGTWQRD